MAELGANLCADEGKRRMQTTLAERVKDAVQATGQPLTSSEIGARLRVARPEVEEALGLLQHDTQLVVREWPIDDPHFGVDRIVVACRVDPANAATAAQAAESACQRVYESILRDFLASHRCV